METPGAESIILTPEQQRALDLMEHSSRNFFVTGKAGTGKSVLLQRFVGTTAKRVAVVAPTGIAAIHVAGQTLHSLLHMNTDVQKPQNAEEVRRGIGRGTKDLLRALDTLVIDEISMVRVDVMDMLDARLRYARGNPLPFGGVQIVAFGDLFQLPPVVGKEPEIEKYLSRRYGTLYFFGAPAIREHPFAMLELEHVFRQKDPTFLKLLNALRLGRLSDEAFAVLNARVLPPPREGVITLTPTNMSAQYVNDLRLRALPTQEHTYTGEIRGTFPPDELPTDRCLALREGAQVMMLRNDEEGRWVNGTLATVATLSEQLIRVSVDGHVFPVDKAVWSKYCYAYHPEDHSICRREIGCFIQYPIRPAYAITIHKSQGQTLDAAVIDLAGGHSFAAGQTYVALSRCRSLASLYLTEPITPNDIRVSQEVLDFMAPSHSPPEALFSPLCHEPGDSNESRSSAMFAPSLQLLEGQKFADSAALLPKTIRAKVQTTLRDMMRNPELPGLHIEKLNHDNLYSARVDDNYRIIFFRPGDSSGLLSLLYVGTHADAYAYAEHVKVEINPSTGGMETVEKVPERITKDQATQKPRSRLNAFSDEQFVMLGIPEEYWEQLRGKVFSKGQLVGFRSCLPETVYIILEFVLDGSDVLDAMDLYASMTETVAPVPVAEKTPFFAAFSPEDLQRVGVPSDHIDRVMGIRTDREMEIVTRTLPMLARQSLYALHGGQTLDDVRRTTFHRAKPADPTDYASSASSPITLAEFAPINSEEALNALLTYPSAKWRVFLHPIQSDIIQQDFSGPARIVGGAGTGKTVVIVHRARRLAQSCPDNEKILVTTYGRTLEYDIQSRLRELCSPGELRAIEIHTVDKLTYDLCKQFLHATVCYESSNRRDQLLLGDLWRDAMRESGITDRFSIDFCLSEWRDFVQAMRIDSREGYLSAERRGRGKPLDKAARGVFWDLAEHYMDQLTLRHVLDPDLAQNRLAELIPDHPEVLRYRSVLIDECQDLRAPALRMLRALAGKPHPNDMYLSGDSRQRIYGKTVSLSKCGIRIVGKDRSRTLELNYRTTEEIYSFALRFQQKYDYDDLDGESLDRKQNTCIFHGPAPSVRSFPDRNTEMEEMIRDIRELIRIGIADSDICIMVRSVSLCKSVMRLLGNKGLKVMEITSQQPDEKDRPGVRIMTMHRGKGLEFSYVYLPCLQDGVIPSKRDLEKADTEEERSDILLSEANLLSVAVTRARRQVWLSYSGEPSMLLSSVM